MQKQHRDLVLQLTGRCAARGKWIMEGHSMVVLAADAWNILEH